MAMLRTNRTVQRRDRWGDRPLLDRVFGGLVLASALLLVPYLVAGHSVADKVVLFGGLPLIGVVAGFFLPRIADWAAEQRWVPFQGPLRLIAGWDGRWVGVGFVVLGLVGGLLMAAAILLDTLKVTVTDTGVGIPANSLPFIFQRFWQGESTAHRGTGGLGLGLALARHFVELHGGTIQAASEGEGKGATFVVTLPLAH